MNRRFIVLSIILLAAFIGLTWLGYRAIDIHARGLAGARAAEFAAVAEQIRHDVKRKLDDFMHTEQKRPYTDYQSFYVPENLAPMQQAAPVLRSPLQDKIEQGLAYGYFEIESDGSVITPYGQPDSRLTVAGSVRRNLLPSLDIRSREFHLPRSKKDVSQQEKKAPNAPAQRFDIESLQAKSQTPQTIAQRRQVIESNALANQTPGPQQPMQDPAGGGVMNEPRSSAPMGSGPGMGGMLGPRPQQAEAKQRDDLVTIRIEPFVPFVIPADDPDQPLVGKKVFLLRHVQIENRHILQGFLLQQKRLMAEIRDSAAQFMRKGMAFEFSSQPNPRAAYAAGLDFGFGAIVLNLSETDAGRIGRQVRQLQFWYFSIVGVVLVAVALGLTSVWRNMREQLRLACKKDDFISAVSHELRTPLTSIRMYTEMLEKNWVKSDDKRNEYYASMRQESERLSRLIENVLDFSRIQRGRKNFAFQLGDLNVCIERALQMLAPAVRQAGFTITTEFAPVGSAMFDPDAVAQIIINLVDNALKYARNADEKTIIVRTRKERASLVIEVEDRGPGIAHHERKRVFEEFYRCEDENRRETTGVGLGLALVNRFVQAHRGLVEILAAQPTGALVRIVLPVA